MFAAQFIFKPGNYDEEFYRLDESIDAYAHTLEGFIGVERWLSQDGETKNSIYYFEDMDTIAKFARFEDHQEAKAKVHNWYRSYRVVISEIKATYGDGEIQTTAK